MLGRKVALYFSWSRPDEAGAPLGALENRFPALFELRRLAWPDLEQFADPETFDQGIEGFLEHIQLGNFHLFMEEVASWTGNPVGLIERRTQARFTPITSELLRGIDTLILMSYESSRTRQTPGDDEINALRAFLDDPDHILFVCPHHDIGDVAALPEVERRAHQVAEFHHHGDPAIPATQRFGDFGIALLDGLGLQVKNCFGLRAAKQADGSPAPLDVALDLDRLGLMNGVVTLNAHRHLPHLERHGKSDAKIDVVARQLIDMSAPVHPFTAGGRKTFDAILQTKPGTFPGTVLICDATTWSSTQGGLEGLRQLWKNLVSRPRK